MPSVHDVAKYILKQRSPITAMKLQKLVYYAQAWSLVWEADALFGERIEAWANGPVVPDLYQVHAGNFKIYEWDRGDASKLSTEQAETVNAVLHHYGKMSSQQLSDLTHSEAPWKLARIGIPDGERGNRVISLAAMEEYYSSL